MGVQMRGMCLVNALSGHSDRPSPRSDAFENRFSQCYRSRKCNNFITMMIMFDASCGPGLDRDDFPTLRLKTSRRL